MIRTVKSIEVNLTLPSSVFTRPWSSVLYPPLPPPQVTTWAEARQACAWGSSPPTCPTSRAAWLRCATARTGERCWSATPRTTSTCLTPKTTRPESWRGRRRRGGRRWAAPVTSHHLLHEQNLSPKSVFLRQIQRYEPLLVHLTESQKHPWWSCREFWR